MPWEHVSYKPAYFGRLIKSNFDEHKEIKQYEVFP